MNSLKERSRVECTQNVVFLFQVARWRVVALPWTSDGEYSHDGEGILLGDVVDHVWRPKEDSEYLTNEQLEGMESVDGAPCAFKDWETKAVFLTRPNAESYGETFSYRWPDGWRVFGVPAMGMLLKVIETREEPAA